MKNLLHWLSTKLVSEADVHSVLVCIDEHGSNRCPLDRSMIQSITNLPARVVGPALGQLEFEGKIYSEFRHKCGSPFMPTVACFLITWRGVEVLDASRLNPA